MSIKRNRVRNVLLASSALAGSLLLAVSPAAAQEKSFTLDIPAQSLGQSLMAFGSTTDQQIVFSEGLVKGRAAPALQGQYTPSQALALLLRDSGLVAQRNTDGVVMIQRAAAPQSGSAAGDGAEVEALIVTAQKREEDIQDVPIAISAFTQEALEAQKIEGGFDLLKAIPNVTFSKNNFTSYNFSIRGIGTKAVSATTDPGVAVSFNNSALLQNRLFEQEYFDIERVEVLRGPQGTLYGRNATAGVVNVITAKPDLNDVDAWVKGEVGNYESKRLSGMVNLPFFQDILAVRLAGAFTSREGFDFNTGTGNAINGRELWSTRLTVGFAPTDHLSGDLVWEHFEEDDNRSRTGKQLCHRDPGPLEIGGTPIGDPILPHLNPRRRATFSQGCLPGSLYDANAFGTPNGLSLPFVLASVYPIIFGAARPYDPANPTALAGLLDANADPYGGLMQNPDLRVIESIKDPRYLAKADVVQLNVDVDLTEALSLHSQTIYNEDSTYSSQDYNRFNTVPIFADTSTWDDDANQLNDVYVNLAPGGQFCDPQLGCSSSLVGYDIATAAGKQFGQEIRLQSDFDGPINFSAGANYTRFQTLVDYYIFYNLITALAMQPPFNNAFVAGENPIETCINGQTPNDPNACPYIDPNTLESINGEGHNYFRSKNPYKLVSTAAFGEVYWNATEALKVTAGLRYTDDRKTTVPVPSQVLLSPSTLGGGDVARGYPEGEPIKQHWGEWSGRLGVDWQPELSFTDQTMVYAFFSRGYKGGGANPPTPGFSENSLIDLRPQTEQEIIDVLTMAGREQFIPQMLERFNLPILYLTSVEYEPTFRPEFVNAYEVGTKNTLLDGALIANASAFLYDYTDYQVSQIRDRTAVNENFDARIWGLEFEGTFAPSRNFQVRGTLGYLDTAIADGETSIDIMNRTQGDPDYTLVRSWMQLPSNCVVPTAVVEGYLQKNQSNNQFQVLCGGTGTENDLTNLLSSLSLGLEVIDPATGMLYDPLVYPEINGGAGLRADLSGNELPNAPHWTASLGAQYAIDLSSSWTATVRGDAYWQSQSWARVYNSDPYDKLHGWYNLNLSLWLENDDGLKVEFYAKNILDKTPITDAFLNSDDTGLTTNVFVLDPRLIGLSVRKEF